MACGRGRRSDTGEKFNRKERKGGDREWSERASGDGYRIVTLWWNGWQGRGWDGLDETQDQPEENVDSVGKANAIAPSIQRHS